MITLTFFFAGLSLFLGIRLWLYKKQIRGLSEELEQLEPESSRRLTCFLRGKEILRLCREINRRTDAWQDSVLKVREAQSQLKYTIACVSHDIRTPLAGASGYMQLLEKSQDEKKRREYCRIIRQRLEDLEGLLEELFFYTRLTGEAFQIKCQRLQLLPVLSDALTGFYQRFQQEGREPVLSFEEEAVEVFADPQQLRRLLRNLISNGLSHGTGPIYIEQKGCVLRFSNQILHPEQLSVDHLFDRFYQGDSSRRGGHAGLGLSIAKELAKRMGGDLLAEKKEGWLILTVILSKEES